LDAVAVEQVEAVLYGRDRRHLLRAGRHLRRRAGQADAADESRVALQKRCSWWNPSLGAGPAVPWRRPEGAWRDDGAGPG
jgi:hypothetical protein